MAENEWYKKNIHIMGLLIIVVGTFGFGFALVENIRPSVFSLVTIAAGIMFLVMTPMGKPEKVNETV